MTVLLAGGAVAAPLDKGGQRCVKTNTKSFSRIARLQGKENRRCLKEAGKGTLRMPLTLCLTADSRRKVQKAGKRTLKIVQRRCAGGPPEFGMVDRSGAATNQLAVAKELAVVQAVFGMDLDGAIVEQANDATGHKCQATVARFAQKCQDAKLKAFSRCTKNALRGRGAPPVASAEELQEACLGSGADPLPDPNGKARKACVRKLGKAIDKRCAGADADNLFPGCAGEDLRACVDRVVACALCVALNGVGGLSRDCDAFDDGGVNGSCNPTCGNGVIDDGEECEAPSDAACPDRCRVDCACGECMPGRTEACYAGPPGTAGIGECRAGTRTCSAMAEWGACAGAVTPVPEICNGLDDDCNGLIDDGVC